MYLYVIGSITVATLIAGEIENDTSWVETWGRKSRRKNMWRHIPFLTGCLQGFHARVIESYVRARALRERLCFDCVATQL